ncbi:2783_t:CDS:2 [Diversispora eburnea]|uniref:Mediator of RNA polymerase II transcription subunit 6 n=1 Tax=Diversispora eburnea TaxID=1213867 RepID=A0A9N8VUD7_9GLOM|nr:2783_t:CDS:2 [Diversispora eburnea]
MDFDLETFDTRHISFRDDYWFQYVRTNGVLTNGNVMEYFSISPFYDRQCNNEIVKMSSRVLNEPIEVTLRYFHQEEIAKQQLAQLEKQESSLLPLSTLSRVDSSSSSTFPTFPRDDSLSEKFEGKLSISEKNKLPTETTTITTNLTNKKKIKNPPSTITTQPPSIIREDSLVTKFSEKLTIANEKGKSVVKSKGEGKHEKKSRKHHKDPEDKDEESVRKKKKKK